MDGFRKRIRLSQVIGPLGDEERYLLMGIFFREIKLEYMLLEDNRVMLCDLGFSESVWFESASYSLSPNDPHIAPELLPDPNAKNFRNPSVPEHDGKASDLFAAGVCLHAMIFGKYPKCSDSNEHYIYDIRDGSSFNIPSHSEKGPVSEGCRDFVAGLLRPDPKERLTMEGILSHPWFNGVVPKEFSEFNEFRFENKKDVQEGCAARKRDMLSVLRERFEKLKLGIKNLLMRRGS
ncbi:hypothetical protein BSKO_05809 [Bryopsis sp. KO-2023]|nr:hypothetical protein BSKO_05809 [Bryopsis sp. KO-2023]